MIIKNKPFINFRTKQKKHSSTRCGAIIFNQDLTKMLIVENNYLFKEKNISKWGMPKGIINYKETFNECAMREIWEETGLNVNIHKKQLFLRINNTYYFPIIINEHDPNYKFNIRDKEEIRSVKWYDIDYIRNCLMLNKDLHILFKNYLYRAKTISNKIV